MSKPIISISIILLLVAIEFVSDIIIKKWTLHQVSNSALLLCFFIFVGAFFLWILAMKVEMFSKTVNYYTILTVIGGTLLGYIFFREKPTLTNLVGVGLAIISLFLVSQ